MIKSVLVNHIHRVTIQSANHNTIIRWCVEQFGHRYSMSNRNGIWATQSANKNIDFHFSDEKAAILFSLKWL